jgi:hypothetical protein
MNVYALRILDQLPFLRLGVGEFDDTGGDGKQLGQLSGAVTPRSRDQLEAVQVRTYRDGLDEAMLPDTLGELMKLAFIKGSARVGCGLVDGVDGEVLECAAVLHDALLWAG